MERGISGLADGESKGAVIRPLSFQSSLAQTSWEAEVFFSLRRQSLLSVFFARDIYVHKGSLNGRNALAWLLLSESLIFR